MLTAPLAVRRGGQLVGRVVGHGHHHDEYGRAAFFGAHVASEIDDLSFAVFD